MNTAVQFQILYLVAVSLSHIHSASPSSSSAGNQHYPAKAGQGGTMKEQGRNHVNPHPTSQASG